jgi:hypothetical protein
MESTIICYWTMAFVGSTAYPHDYTIDLTRVGFAKTDLSMLVIIVKMPSNCLFVARRGRLKLAEY